MKPLTTSIYTFETLRSGGFLYVDKTEAIHRLLQPASAQYFLSRPRRFGKSLLISTLKAIFQDRRDLFQGLALDALAYDWTKHPVLHLDMGSRASGCVAELEENLMLAVGAAAEDQGIEITTKRSYQAFEELIRRVAQSGNRTVILIDEYDKPLLGHLGKKSAEPIRQLLKQFYAVIKATEPHQRFVLITGVSKFSKVSIFSDLNNLTDLTMLRSTATLLGYTQEELEANFPDYIDRLAAREGMDRDSILARLAEWYNGYRFEETAPTVYNPVSVMKCFQEEKFKNYWFETGTPTFLVELLKQREVDLTTLEEDQVSEESFSTYEVDRLEPLPLLVQTGYLTIGDVIARGEERFYRLVFPNREIQASFTRWLAEAYADVPLNRVDGALNRIVDALEARDPDAALRTMRVFFSTVPNRITIQHEHYYQSIVYVVFRLVGLMVNAEVSTNIGYVDAVVETDTLVYVLEFKLHDTPEAAIKQIREKRYFERYLDRGKDILLVGAAFDVETRNIERWLVETP